MYKPWVWFLLSQSLLSLLVCTYFSYRHFWLTVVGNCNFLVSLLYFSYMKNTQLIENSLPLIEMAIEKLDNPQATKEDLNFASKIVGAVIENSVGYNKDWLDFYEIRGRSGAYEREELLRKTREIYQQLLNIKRDV